MPRPHPPEFRRRALELGNQRGPDAIACSRWPRRPPISALRLVPSQLDRKGGHRRGRAPGSEHDNGRELVVLRRRNRVLETKNEILKRAAPYNPRRRHSYCSMLSPADYEAAHRARRLDLAA